MIKKLQYNDIRSCISVKNYNFTQFDSFCLSFSLCSFFSSGPVVLIYELLFIHFFFSFPVSSYSLRQLHKTLSTSLNLSDQWFPHIHSSNSELCALRCTQPTQQSPIQRVTDAFNGIIISIWIPIPFICFLSFWLLILPQ